jgi:hypothetical protein
MRIGFSTTLSREQVISWFTGLSADEKCAMMVTFQSLLDKQRNCSYMDVESVEKTILMSELVKLPDAIRKLRANVYHRRRVLAELKSRCMRRPTGTTLDRMLISMGAFPRCHITYQSPRRGDLGILTQKWNICLSEYQSGATWTYLRPIIYAVAHLTATWGCPKLTFTNLNDAFLTYSGWMRDIMLPLGAVCKEWRVALKHHCIWWGPEGQYFALC